ncbi:hypothetical protein CP970_21155 [Streptomyces kanamyceticus]|uniref:Uncharacterized protein n=1 Tax=Streptomyces kanamyceticus TaxID=1967 RepID=A0A5J6GDT0_STRKN|nr:hypothetical protein CP970_21155 [Streptomyces kanamyceticus]
MVNGVDGYGHFKNWTHNSAKISFVTYDTLKDKRHVAIRLISKTDYDGKIRYWGWHHNRKGYNKKDVVETTASTGKYGLSYIGIQAAVMDGKKVAKSCKAWGQGT